MKPAQVQAVRGAVGQDEEGQQGARGGCHCWHWGRLRRSFTWECRVEYLNNLAESTSITSFFILSANSTLCFLGERDCSGTRVGESEQTLRLQRQGRTIKTEYLNHLENHMRHQIQLTKLVIMPKRCYRLLVTPRMCQECGVSCCRWFLIKRRMRSFSIYWMFSAEAEPAHHKRVKRHIHIYVEEEHSPPVHYMGVSWISQTFCNNQFVKFLSITCKV